MTTTALTKWGWLAMAAVLCGCVHTTISRERISADTHKPYQKLLVCSMSNQEDRVRVAEDTLVKKLAGHKVHVSPCHDFFAGANRSTLASQIRATGYDGVLVVYRAPGIAEENVDEAARIPYPTLAAVVKGYGGQATDPSVMTKESVKRLPGQGDVIAAGVDLLDVQDDRVVWSNAGTVEGPSGHSLSDYAKSGADAVTQRLLQEKIIR